MAETPPAYSYNWQTFELPKVSIIMCAYNVAPFIAKAIRSILTQTYTNWELIIADDASTDDTVAIAEQFLSDGRVRLYKSAVNTGYIANKNNAFGYASGALLTQLDADDICPPQRIAHQVGVFVNDPALQMCGTNYQIINLNDEVRWVQQYDKDETIEFSTNPYPFWFPGLMFKRSLIDEFGLFSEYFTGIYGDDHHWTMRVNHRYPIYFIKEVLYSYRTNPNSLTNVLDNTRKLIVPDILAELRRQRLQNGTDMIELGRVADMHQFEQSVLASNILMSERCRVWLAKAIDQSRYAEAFPLLKNVFALNPFGIRNYRTFFYLLRKLISTRFV